MKHILKRILAISLVVVYGLINVQSIFADSTRSYVSKQINGSPIITGNWQTESGEMATEEAIALSVYMSNYAIPMYDNFESAFTKADWGSQGAGLKYITFNDSDVVKQNMQAIYDKVISLQTSPDQVMEIKKRSSKDDTDSGDSATLGDFIDLKENEFYVEVDGSTIVIADFKNKEKYDRTLFVCGFLKAGETSSIKNKVNENIKNMKNNYIGLDRCGNVVVLDDEDMPNLILYPACLNPQLFNNYTVNFINDYMLTRTITDDADGWNNFSVGKLNIRDKSEEKLSKWLPSTDFGIVLNHNVVGAGFWDAEGEVGKMFDNITDDKEWEKQKRGDTTVVNEICDYHGESLGNLINQKNKPTDKNFGLNASMISAMKDAGVRQANGYVNSKNLYANYLLLAFRDEGKQGWNQALFKGIVEQIKNAVSMDKMSQEEKTEVITNNIYSYVTDSKALSKKLINVTDNWFLDRYEDAVNYDETRLNSSKPIFSVPTMGKNIITRALIGFLVNNLFYVILLVLGLTIAVGLFSGGKFTNYLFKGLTLSVLIVLMPIIFNRVIGAYEDIINSAFQRDANYYAINEDIKWERLMGSHADIKDEDTKAYIQMYNNLIYDTNSYIKYDQDKSPVVTNNATEEMMNILQSTVTGQMFLGGILRQYQSNSSLKDRTASVVIDLYKKWFNVVALWDDTVADGEVGLVEASLIKSDSAFANISRKKTTGDKLKNKFLSDSERKLNWANYESVRGDEEYKSYVNRSDLGGLEHDTTYRTVVKVLDENGKEKQEYDPLFSGITRTFDIHKSFYLLDGLNLGSQNKYENDLKSTVSSNEEEAIKKIYNKIIVDNSPASTLKIYNETDENKKINRNYGYMYLTENVSPYFYAVYYDLFGDKSVNDIGHAIMGGLVFDDSNSNSIGILTDTKGNVLRNSVFVHKNKIRDFADLEELFTNVIPYCWRVMTISDKAFGDEKITEDEYPLYKGNPKRWLFDCNWIPKVINTLNRSYGQIKVFSEIQGEATNKGELLIQEFYKNLYPQMEQLVNYINMPDMTKDVLIRQMALITTIEFNKEFSSWLNELEPRSIDIGGSSLDTVFSGMLINCSMSVSQQHSAGYNLQANGYGVVFMIITAFLMGTVIPFIREVLVGLLFMLCYVNLLIKPMAGNRDVEMTSTMTMVVSAILGLIKALATMSIPIFLLLWFARPDVKGIINLNAYNDPNGGFVYTAEILLLIVSCIVSIFLGIGSCAGHLGFYRFANGKIGFSLGQMSSMNSASTLAGLGAIGTGIGLGAGALASTGIGKRISKSRIGKAGQKVMEGAGNVVAKVTGFKNNTVETISGVKQKVSETGRKVYSKYNESQFSRQNRYKIYNEETEKRMVEAMKEKTKGTEK